MNTSESKVDQDNNLERASSTSAQPPMIKLYNTLTRQIDEFAPINPDNIRIYSCGPTVYHYQHIGNMRYYVFVDILHRTLKTKYDHITHVTNITDVGHLVSDGDSGEDKMEKGSKRTGKSVWEIAEMYTKEFMLDLERLNLDADEYTFTKATDYIKEQIKMVQKLERGGYTYTTSDGVYFDTSKWENIAL